MIAGTSPAPQPFGKSVAVCDGHSGEGEPMFSFLRRDRRIQPLDAASMDQPIYRHFSHGPIQPMEQPGLLARIFCRR